MATTHLTKEGLVKLQEELYDLKNRKLPGVLGRLKEAIAQGDISENAEYDTAMGEKELLEARISDIEQILQNVEIIEHTDASEIRYGATVVIKDDKGILSTRKVVGSGEIGILGGTVSFDSPLGHALKGKKEGDTIQIRAPQKKWTATIMEVR